MLRSAQPTLNLINQNPLAAAQPPKAHIGIGQKK